MFAFPVHHPQPTFHSTSTTSARTKYEHELERLAFLTEQHEQQRRRAEAAARRAALAAYVEEQERRHREEAFSSAVQQELARRRQAALVQEALEHRAALARRVQQERDAALYRQGVVEAAQRRAALVAREQHRRRVEAEQDQRRRVVEARRQQRQRQGDFPQSLVQLFLDLATSASHADEQEQQAVAAPASSSSPAPTSSAAPRAPSPAAAEPSLPDPAIEGLQKRFERDAARQAALDTLNRLSNEFDSRLSSFASPSTLTFQSPPSTSTSTTMTPPLAYGKPNAAFLGHEDFLVSLLSKVDAVSSGGDKVIKQARRDLVKRVEVELAKLDQLKEHEWERQSQEAASEVGEGSVRGRDDASAAAAPSPFADTDVVKPEPALELPTATTSPSSSSALDESPPAPADTSARLTAESLASLPTSSAEPASTVPRPRSRASTTSLASDTSSAVDRYVAEMLRRAKELAERIAAKEDAERAASASAPARDETAAGDEAVEAPSAAAPVVEDAAHGELTAVEASASAPAATEPLEDGVDEEIDVEATLRLKRSPSAAATARPSTVPVKEEERAEREEAVEEREEVASEAGTEEFLVV
ncbi:hypothetical protein JCM8208_006168 [Rhodotorula glutinis]